MLTTILLALWLTMHVARGTPIGTALRHMMVDAPARILSRITRGQVLLFLAVGAIALTLIWLLENDGRLLVAMGLPEVMSFAAAIDLASLLDLVVVAVIATSTIRVRVLRTTLGRRLASRRPRPRARRSHKPANDDEDHPAVIVAVAA